MNTNELEIKTQLKRLLREYPVTSKQLSILFTRTQDIYKCEDFCILLEEGENWKAIIKDLKEFYGG